LRKSAIVLNENVREYIIKGRYEDRVAARGDGVPNAARFDLAMILATKAATVPPTSIATSPSYSQTREGQISSRSGGGYDGELPFATRLGVLEPAWSVEEEVRARAAWMDDEAKKPAYQKPQHRGQSYLWRFDSC
jgi:hypothetical protein